MPLISRRSDALTLWCLVSLACGLAGFWGGQYAAHTDAAEAGVGRFAADPLDGSVRFEWIQPEQEKTCAE